MSLRYGGTNSRQMPGGLEAKSPSAEQILQFFAKKLAILIICLMFLGQFEKIELPSIFSPTLPYLQDNGKTRLTTTIFKFFQVSQIK